MYSQYGGSATTASRPSPTGQPPAGKPPAGAVASGPSAGAVASGPSGGAVAAGPSGQPPAGAVTSGSSGSSSDSSLDYMTLVGLLSSVGIKSSNMDDILEGTVADVENRIQALKMKLDSNENIVEEEKSQLSVQISEFEKNLQKQKKLYDEGEDAAVAADAADAPAGDGNLFVQLEVHRPMVSLSTENSKETFLKILRDTRIFKEETRETFYLNAVREIQAGRKERGEGVPDISVINQGLKDIQKQYIMKLQQLIDSVGGNKPYYTGVRQYRSVGYETDNLEGFLQMPVIMNSKRYTDMKSELFLRHEGNAAPPQSYFRGVNATMAPNPPEGNGPNAVNLLLDTIRAAAAAAPALPAAGTKIIRTRGGNRALFVSPDPGDSHGDHDFMLTKPVNLVDNEIKGGKDDFDRIVSEQTIYGAPTTPQDVNKSMDRIARAIYRGNGTEVNDSDPKKCLAGLIPFDESIFTNLLGESALIQSRVSDGVTDTPIIWRGNQYSFIPGTPNSLEGVKDGLKTGADAGVGRQVYPGLNKLKDTSDSNMIKALELDKLCEDFQKKLSECNGDGNDKGWAGLGWLFKPSQDNADPAAAPPDWGGCFNYEYRRAGGGGGERYHLVDDTKSNGMRVRKTETRDVPGGLKLKWVCGDVNRVAGGGATPEDAFRHTGQVTIDNFDQIARAYQVHAATQLYDSEGAGVPAWGGGNGQNSKRNIAEITRRRCILFLFHFLEKAFDAEWWCAGRNQPASQMPYKVKINKDKVYKKLSDWAQVSKWWTYTTSSVKCVVNSAVCTYNGETGGAGPRRANHELWPEELSAEECLLCFARHLFIGKTNGGRAEANPRHAHEDEVKVWDIIEEFLPKFYRCAIVIRHKETVKNFYNELETYYASSPLLEQAKTIDKQNTKKKFELESQLLNDYPQAIYRDLLVRMYDTEEEEEDNKRYCCSNTECLPYKGDGRPPPFQRCNVCAVAHYFFDMPEARDSYDFKTYGNDHKNVVAREQPLNKVHFVGAAVVAGANQVENTASADFNYACSDWNKFNWGNRGGDRALFKLDNVTGLDIKGSTFDINGVQKDYKSTAVVKFDKKDIDNTYGYYVRNEPYAFEMAKFKIEWPKVFEGQTGLPNGNPAFPSQAPGGGNLSY